MQIFLPCVIAEVSETLALCSPEHNMREMHLYEVRPRKDGRGFDLISEALPFGGLWYLDADAAIGYAKFYSRSHQTEIRVFDVKGNVIETHKSDGEFREP